MKDSRLICTGPTSSAVAVTPLTVWIAASKAADGAPVKPDPCTIASRPPGTSRPVLESESAPTALTKNVWNVFGSDPTPPCSVIVWLTGTVDVPSWNDPDVTCENRHDATVGSDCGQWLKSE
jgi:hypothetical protein